MRVGTKVQELSKLISSAQSGDMEAYDQIVHRFQHMAVAYGYSVLGDFHWAEDAAQEAFVEAFRCLPSLQEPLAFPGWLRRIVFKQCDRLTRKKQIGTLSLRVAIEEVSLDCDPQRALEKQETALQVRDAVSALPEHEQSVTLLFYMGQHSQLQIAEFLEVPLTTVKKRLHTARKKLKKRISEMLQESKDTMMNNETDHWNPTVIEPDSPQWEQAVALKRERAFSMLEQDGLTRQEVEQKYNGYHREQGIAFHDRKLREAVMGGHLLGWWQDDALMAYASVQQTELLGYKHRLVYNVLDVCVSPLVPPAGCEAIVASLHGRAQEARSSYVQIDCGPELYPSIAASGGRSVKQCFQWRL